MRRRQLGPEARNHRIEGIRPLQLDMGDLVGNGDFETFVHAEKLLDYGALRSAEGLTSSHQTAAPPEQE